MRIEFVGDCTIEIAHMGTAEEICNQYLRDAIAIVYAEVWATAAKLKDYLEIVFADIREQVIQAIDDAGQMPTPKAVLDAISKLSMPSPGALTDLAPRQHLPDVLPPLVRRK